MKNYVQKGEKIQFIATVAVDSGEVVDVGALSGVAAGACAIGETVVVELEGVYTVPKLAGAITLGAKLYHDGNGNATTTVSTHNFLGYAFTAQASGDATVNVRLIS